MLKKIRNYGFLLGIFTIAMFLILPVFAVAQLKKHPYITVTKTGPKHVAVGEEVYYKYKLTTSLLNFPADEIHINDDKTTEPQLIKGDDGDNILEDGEEWEYTSSYVPTEEDIQKDEPGFVTNTVTVTTSGLPPGGIWEGEATLTSAVWRRYGEIEIEIGEITAGETIEVSINDDIYPVPFLGTMSPEAQATEVVKEIKKAANLNVDYTLGDKKLRIYSGKWSEGKFMPIQFVDFGTSAKDSKYKVVLTYWPARKDSQIKIKLGPKNPTATSGGMFKLFTGGDALIVDITKTSGTTKDIYEQVKKALKDKFEAYDYKIEGEYPFIIMKNGPLPAKIKIETNDKGLLALGGSIGIGSEEEVVKGYNTSWLTITAISSMLAGGYLLFRRKRKLV